MRTYEEILKTNTITIIKQTRSREGTKFTSRSKRWYSDGKENFRRGGGGNYSVTMMYSWGGMHSIGLMSGEEAYLYS